MTDKIPSDAALRSRVADLLHLLQFARIETPTAGDAEQAEKAMNDLERMLAAPPTAEQPAAATLNGWKLVPVEPTPEMIERSQYWHRCREPQVPPENFRGFYDALLAAAPAAPVAREPAAELCADAEAGEVTYYTFRVTLPRGTTLYAAQPDTVVVPRAVLADIAQDAEDSGAQLLANRLRALLAGGAE